MHVGGLGISRLQCSSHFIPNNIFKWNSPKSNCLISLLKHLKGSATTHLCKKLTNLSDLLEGGQDPFFILQFLHEAVDPLHLLSIPVLGTTVVQDLDVSCQSLVHDVCGHVLTVGQVPQQSQHLPEVDVLPLLSYYETCSRRPVVKTTWSLE